MEDATSLNGSRRGRRRTQTHASQDAVKSVKYEEAPSGTPPVPVTSVGQHRAPSAGRSSARSESRGKRRPKTAGAASTRPNTIVDHRHRLEEAVKRDSGFAPSTTTAARESYAESQQEPASPTHVATRVPSLPTIAVQDEPHVLSPLKRIKSPFARKKSHEPLIRTRSNEETGTTGIQRIKSFRGIQTSIPSGEWEEFNSDGIGFSARGSLLFGGKKMQELIAAAGEGTVTEEPVQDAVAGGDFDEKEAVNERPGSEDVGKFGGLNHGISGTSESHAVDPPVQEPAPDMQIEDTTLETESGDQRGSEEVPRNNSVHKALPSIPDTEADEKPLPNVPSITIEETARPGLVTGKRKPSVHMLQAAISGGRVLSAEEITFSMRVRTMYEHGDENAADWTSNARMETPESLRTDRSTPDPNASTGDLAVDKTRNVPYGGLRGRASGNVRSSYTKSSYELAGGIEDWEDIEGGTVDRFGFIAPKRVVSAGYDNYKPDGVHRVATGLRALADEPRRERSMMRRGLSNARSSRSAPPRKDPDGSLHSFQSSRSEGLRRGRFRSKDRRVMDEASGMLKLPPGLSKIAEDQDAGRTADMRQRKEWERNEKWLKMARQMPENPQTTGGGMQFNFDTKDAKVISRTWKGIPDRWRSAAWHSFLSASAKRRGPHASDEELTAEFHQLQEASCADDVQIDVDVPRTINMHIMFRRRYRGGQRLLFRVLHAIALYCPESGYVQGMASLAATLLCYYDEERAFVMLVRLWQLRGLEQLFKSGFDGLMAALAQFESDWLCGGEVALRLDEMGINSTAYGTRWYLTLFNLSVPFPAQLRIWDVFMLLGDASPGAQEQGVFGGADLDVLHATSAALIDATREIIMDTDFEGAMKVLTSFVPIKDDDLLMRVARAEYKTKKKRAL